MYRFILVLPALIVSSYGLFAVDSSELVPEATYVKALGEGFTRAIIRGYEEACSIGGEVDPNFVSSYNNARAAGYTDIDTYWFPCNGSGNDCKSYATQLSELAATFSANKMDVGTIWIDLEQDSVCDNVSIRTTHSEPHTFVIRFIDWDLHYSLIMARLATRLRLRTFLPQWRIPVSNLVSTAARESVIQIKYSLNDRNWL